MSDKLAERLRDLFAKKSVTKLPMTEEQLALVGEAAEAIERLTRELDHAENRHWHDGEPPKPWRDEWFIAETIYGARACLKALPEDWTYDYTTADQTYIMARNIKRWMRFPDSEFIEPTPSAAEARIAKLKNACGEALDYFNKAGLDEEADAIRKALEDKGP